MSIKYADTHRHIIGVGFVEQQPEDMDCQGGSDGESELEKRWKVKGV
jgi:hypothetical protein